MSFRALALMFVLACVNPVRAHDAETEALIVNLEQSIRDPLLNLNARDLLDHPAKDVYILKSEVAPSPAELATAARMARDTGYQILLLPHFPILGHVPVVDAIAFDRQARPVANLSLKTVAARSAHPPRAAIDLIRSFRHGFFKYYQSMNMQAALSKLGTPRALEQRAFDALIAMLGLDGAVPRPVWLAVDLTLQSQLGFVVDESENYGPVFRFFRADGEPYPRHIETRRLRRPAHDVWLLFGDATVRACASELKITLFP